MWQRRRESESDGLEIVHDIEGLGMPDTPRLSDGGGPARQTAPQYGT